MRVEWQLEDEDGERSGACGDLRLVGRAAVVCARFRGRPIKVVEVTRGKGRGMHRRVVHVQRP